MRPALDVGAGAVTREDDAVGAEAGEGVAHDRPRHREGGGELCLGRQAGALAVLTADDLLEDLLVDAVGELDRPDRRNRRKFNRFSAVAWHFFTARCGQYSRSQGCKTSG